MTQESSPGGQPDGPEQSADDIIAELMGTELEFHTTAEMFVGLPSREENRRADLMRLPKGELGFLGLNLVENEDGSFVRKPDGSLMKFLDLPGKHGPDDNPFIS